jgi:hypothetical protein
VHLFWLSHEEKRPWLDLSMGGTMGELIGEGREGEMVARRQGGDS